MNDDLISVKQHEREIRRWFAAFLIVLILLVATVAGWIWSEKKHYSDDFGFDYMWVMPDEDLEPTIAYG